jgi:uncharacterized protein involved in exopolysaccharide biosynthesis
MTKALPSADPLDYDRTVTLRDLLLFAVRNRWIILASAIFFGAATLGVAKLLPPKYMASVTLVPAASRGSSAGVGSLSSAVSQFSGLASMAGIHIGNTSGTQALALATLKSRLLLNKYIERHDLMPMLFPGAWNAKAGKWRSSNIKKDPTLWDADQLFLKIRTIKSGVRSGVVTMTVTWRNPVVAAQWANGLVALTNRYLRQQTIGRTKRELAYLREEIPKTNIVEVRNAIYTLMQEEIKTLMIATARKQFAFRVVDPAIPPSGKISPRPLLWTIAGALFGMLFGVFFAVIRETLHTNSGPTVSSEPTDVPLKSNKRATPSLSPPTDLTQ